MIDVTRIEEELLVRLCRGRQGRPDCTRPGSPELDGHCLDCFESVTDDLFALAETLAAENAQPEDAYID